MTELFLLDDEGKLKTYIFKLIIADYRRHEIIVRLIVGMRDNLVGVYYNMYRAVVLIVTDVLYTVQPPALCFDEHLNIGRMSFRHTLY